jgi:biopolymer transport protein ExbD
MLDMAFQLLTFFVLTYRPAPIEGQFSMNLLPPQPATRIDATPPPESAASSELPVSLRTVTAILRADEAGNLGAIALAENDVRDLEEFQLKARELLENPDLPFDQTLIQVDPRLKYEGLMQIIDILSKYTSKISFDVLDELDLGVDL